jgi:hypothetical protein
MFTSAERYRLIISKLARQDMIDTGVDESLNVSPARLLDLVDNLYGASEERGRDRAADPVHWAEEKARHHARPKRRFRDANGTRSRRPILIVGSSPDFAAE